MFARACLAPIALALLAECGRPPGSEEAEVIADPATPAEESAVEGGDEPPLRLHMKGQLAAADTMRDAIRRGDLEAARAPASSLYQRPAHAELRPVWTPYAAAMQGAAHDVAYATDLPEAARAMGRLARTCGDCHLEVEADASSLAQTVPAPNSRAKHHGPTSRYALESLWAGLAGPAESRWADGVTALVDPGGDGAEVRPDRDAADASRRLAQRALGGRAREAASAEARAEVFAEFLLTCATCHAAPR